MGSAHAGTMITEWKLTADAAFQDETGEPLADLINNGDYISWGLEGGNYSHLVIGDQSGYDGTTPAANANGHTEVNGIMTNGAFEDAATLTHVNNVIAYNTSLTSVTIQDTISLEAVSPAGFSLGPIVFPLFIEFQETPNTEGTCVDDSISVCDDIFVLVNPENLSFSFVEDGYLYTVTLDLGDTSFLDDDACALAGAESGCQGFLTEENTFTTLYTSVAITAEEVSEPAMLGLLGLGLVFAGLRRRKA
ncbi:PEP-CTERM sorting domain-containing protein [Emcibacter nanhaiensis]|uniref:PEP-CTERM sorting domain-containing protein n=2 Tax=Emcibacter nanhaiensis TaxID=1505037 RepID=A0A501PSG3_9PROT|nr:PEP-CTERM sorting domain-containing protein [Emcibacter nanhaiensis]